MTDKMAMRYLSPVKSLMKKLDFDRHYIEALDHAIRNLKERPRGEWISVKYRPLTVEQRIAFAEHYGVEYCDTLDEKAFDCPMPEDGQEILVSTSWGVRADVASNYIDGDGFICYGLEENGDWDGIDAWMPLPEPYKKTENETNKKEGKKSE